MEQEEVQDFAIAHDLDVREIESYHYRLMDSFGEYVLDVYFKRTKGGNISRNAVLQWKTNKWFKINTQQELLKLI